MTVRVRTAMLLSRLVAGFAFVLAGALKLQDPAATVAIRSMNGPRRATR